MSVAPQSPSDPTPLRQYLVRGVSGSFALKVGSVGLVLASNIILARNMGTGSFGAYSYIIAIVSLFSIPATLGFPQLIIREIAKYKVEQQWSLLKGILFRANQLTLLTALLVAAIFAAVTPFITWGERGFFLLALPLLLVNALTNIRGAATQGLRHVVIGQLPEFVLRPLLFVILLTSVLLSGAALSVSNVLWLQIVSALIAFGVGVVLLIRVFPPEAKKVRHEYRTRRWLKSALPFLFLGAVYFVTNQIDLVMLGMLRSNAEVGVYKVAVQGGQLVVFILVAVNATIGPLIAEFYQASDLVRLKKLATRSARVVLLGSLPIGLIFIVFGRFLIDFVFGPAYGSASMPLAILCVGQLVNAGMGSVGLILNMTGHERDTLRGIAFAAVLNIGLNALFIPRFGIEGAAWASAISMICWNAFLGVQVFRRLGFWAHALARVA